LMAKTVVRSLILGFTILLFRPVITMDRFTFTQPLTTLLSPLSMVRSTLEPSTLQGLKWSKICWF
jgi:hypothetical protein